MAQRNSLQPGLRRGIVAGVLAALSSLMHRGKPVVTQDPFTGQKRSHFVQPQINWLKGSLISGRTAPGARGG